MTAPKIAFRASAAARLALCPGSGLAEAGLPDTTSDDAAAGTRMHAILAMRVDPDAPAVANITEEEADLADAMQAKAEAAMGFALAETTAYDSAQAEVSVSARLWTGTADAVVWTRDEAHLIDWKTGYGRDVPDADSNAQLRVYALGLWEWFKPALIHAHLVTRAKATSVTFDAAAMRAAAGELDAIRVAAMDPAAKRAPCAQACKYCKAFGVAVRCPESVALPTVARATIPEAAEAVAALPAAKLADLLGLAALVEKLAKKLRDEAKARLEADASAIPGWTLKPGTMRRTVEDVPAAVSALIGAGLSESDALRCCDLSLPEAARVASDARNLKRKDGEAWVAGVLAGLIEAKRSAPQLVEVVP